VCHASPAAALVSCLVVLAALPGCGGGKNEEHVPLELVGTYTSTLEPSDIPENAAPELQAGEWELVIATSVPDGGPALAIKTPSEETPSGLPGLTVDGDTLELEQEEW
jgi:hypothetical protein